MLEDAQVESPAVVVSPAAGPLPEGVQPVLMPLPGTSAGLPYSSDVQDASQIPAGAARCPKRGSATSQPLSGLPLGVWAATGVSARSIRQAGLQDDSTHGKSCIKDAG